MYRRRMSLFVGIGLLFVPIALLIALLQTVVTRASSVAGISTEGEGGGLLVLLAVAVGTALTLLALGFVQMATARALVEIDAGRPVGALRAYRLAFGGLRSLFVALMIAVVAVSLLAGSVVLIPIAIWLAVRWALIAPAIELEGLSGFEALRRSGHLVRRKWLKVGSLTILGAAIAFVTGSLAGVLLILVTDAPLAAIDVVAGIVYAVTLPFIALTTAYVYFDTRVRDELAGPVVDQLSAEIVLDDGVATPRPEPEGART
jgi:hypothetical protein